MTVNLVICVIKLLYSLTNNFMLLMLYIECTVSMFGVKDSQEQIVELFQLLLLSHLTSHVVKMVRPIVWDCG